MAIPYYIGDRSAFAENYSDFLQGDDDLEQQYIDELANHKRKKLGLENQGSSYDEGYSTVLGQKVQNHNKDYNEYTPSQMSALSRKVYDKYGIVTDENGLRQRSIDKGTDQYLLNQDEPANSFYRGDANLPNVEKLGVARWDAKSRYTKGNAAKRELTADSTYGWEPGNQGINPDKAVDTKLVNNAAGDMEGLHHGNIFNIGNRVNFDDGSLEARIARRQLGSGASEYYAKPTTLEEEYKIQDVPVTPKMSLLEKKLMQLSAPQTATLENTMYPLYGKTPEEKDAISKEQYIADKNGWTGKDIMLMDGKEKANYQKIKKANQLKQGYYSDDGKTITGILEFGKYAIQAGKEVTRSGIKATNRFAKGLAYKLAGEEGERKFSKASDKVVNVIYDKMNGITDEYLEKKLRINKDYINKANADLDKNYEEGDFTGMAASVIDNFAGHMIQSLPEMIMIANPVTFTAAINKRANEQSEKFKKKTGREPSDGEYALMLLLNAGILQLEKLALLPGKAIPGSGKLLSKITEPMLKAIPDSMKRVIAGTFTKPATSMLQQTGRNVETFARGTVKRAAFEGVQEPLDQANSNYWERGLSDKGEGFTDNMKWIYDNPEKVLSQKEGITAAIAGGMLGVVLGGGSQAIETHGQRKRDNERTRTRVNWFENMQNMTPEDVTVQREALEVVGEALQENINTSEAVEEAVNRAETVEDIENIGAEQTTAAVEQAKNIVFDDDEVMASQEVEEAISDFAVDSIESMAESKDLVEIMGQEEANKKIKEIDKAVEDRDTNEHPDEDKYKDDLMYATLVDELTKAKGKHADKWADNDLKNSMFNKNKDRYTQKIKDETLTKLSMAKNAAKHEMKLLQEGIDDFNNADSRINEKGIDTKQTQNKIKKDDLKAIMDNEPKDSFTNIAKRKYRKKLEDHLKMYTDKAIEKAIASQPDSDILNEVGSKVLEARRKAREGTGTKEYRETASIEDTDVDELDSINDDTTFSKSRTQKGKNFERIKRLVSQHKIESKADVKEIKRMIDDLEDGGMLNKKQAELLHKRLKQSGKYASNNNAGSIKKSKTFEDSHDISKDIHEMKRRADKLEASKPTDKDIDTTETDFLIDGLKENIKERTKELSGALNHERLNRTIVDEFDADAYDKNEDAKEQQEQKQKQKKPKKQKSNKGPKTTDQGNESTDTEEEAESEPETTEDVEEEVEEDETQGTGTTPPTVDKSIDINGYSVSKERGTGIEKYHINSNKGLPANYIAGFDSWVETMEWLNDAPPSQGYVEKTTSNNNDVISVEAAKEAYERTITDFVDPSVTEEYGNDYAEGDTISVDDIFNEENDSSEVC